MKLETETLRARVAEARDVSGRALLAHTNAPHVEAPVTAITQ